MKNMAKGDIISGIFTASGNFQPAAGIEIIIIHLTNTATGDKWEYRTGVNLADIIAPSGTWGSQVGGGRVGIQNALFLSYSRTTLNGAYSGVQVK